MQSFVIQGGRPLSGTIRASGNKNGALPILAATVLASEEVRLSNLPRIRDVEVMVELLVDLGADAAWTGPNEVRVDSSGVSKTELNPDLCREIRASFLLAGPLLARFGRAVVPPPGGDVIGRRRLDTHIHAFAALGVEMEINGAYDLRAERLVGTRMYLDEASVMGTENAIMAAVLAEGETIVGHAACEPHIQDLCRFLVTLGAQIDGIGSNVLRIRGVDRLSGGAYRIGPEHIEVASFAVLAAVTGGDLTIEDVEPDDLISIVPAFRKLGIELEVGESTLRVRPGQKLGVMDDLGGQIPKIESGIWPAFPADLTSIAVVAATQATGTVLVFEKMFESRLFFVDKLVSMGARIILCDPHRAVVTGPARLVGQRLESPDIRAGMAMVIAALCANGPSSIGNIRQIDRGYERIDERLRALGADIERGEL
jgi:UDP-N-acetylglucosamine 1-carboxyvinyltransferase